MSDRVQEQSAWEKYGNWEVGKPLMVGHWELGLYHPSPESAAFWQGVREHRLLLPRCTGCGRHHHPGRIVCFDCNSDDFEWVDAEGGGVVYSFTTIHRDLSRIGGETPYDVGVVRLTEGVHLFTRFVTSAGAGALTIDDPVTVSFEKLPVGFDLPVFVKGAVSAGESQQSGTR